MPKLEDLELQIKQTGNVDTKSIKGVADALSKLAEHGARLGNAAKSIRSVNDSIKGINAAKASALASVASALSRLSTSADKASNAAGNIINIGSALRQMTDSVDPSRINSASEAISNFKKAVNSLTRTGESRTSSVRAAVESAVPSYGNDKARNNAGAVLAETTANVSEATNKMEKFKSSLRFVGSLGKTAFKEVANSSLVVAKSFGKLFSTMGAAAWDGLKSKVIGLTGAVGNLVHSFARIAMYRALRTAIKAITQGFGEGIKHLYEWSRVMDNTFKNSMDSLATSAHYLRDSLGAMASPLIDALAPAIEFVVDKFVSLLNIVNQFIATFTGASTWRRAVRTPTEYSSGLEEAAKSAKKATEAQKKLNKTLMDFDEIHLITTSTTKGSNPSSPSGGSGGGEDYSTHFVEEPIADWIQAIKDAIANGDWYGAGAMLADKLNSIVDNWDAEGWGRRLGQAVQHGLEFYLGFMQTFNWDELGGKFADFLNGFIDEVDPNTLGEAIVAKFNAAIDTLNGFSKRFNWDDAGKWLADVLVGAFTGIKWGTLGELIKNLSDGLLKMIKAGLTELLSRKKEVMSAIGDFFTGLGWDGLKNVVELATIVLGFKALFSAVFGDAGLIAAVKAQAGNMLTKAGLSGGFVLTATVTLVWGVSEIIDNIKEYGFQRGMMKSLGVTEPTLRAALVLGQDNDNGVWNAFKSTFDTFGATFTSSGIEIPIKAKWDGDFVKQAQRAFDLIKKFLQALGFEIGETGTLPTSSTPTVNQNDLGAMFDPTTNEWFTTPTLPNIPSGSMPDTLYGSQILYNQTNAIKENLDYINKTPAVLTYKSNNYTTLKNQKIYLEKDLSPTVFWTQSGYKKVLEHRTAFAKKITTTVTFKPIVETSANRGKSTTLLSNKQLSKLLDLRAEGGFPDVGSLFVAGEAGPEMVGNIHGKTGVASGKEVTGIADAVYATGESEAALLKEQNALLRQILAKNTNITLAPNAAAGKWASQSLTAYARATG